ncbi:conserved hypothetical protein [Sporisorium reilianum SRZ2]|uniref:RING-type domain-containing protein n=1 Tax=Sporisorium reilianum (strain SRZ2) TaxID=999809 RepID=E6ZQ48_SPORE|nr:conserved hypothetical protein [Sporisorium reilianum SRZ2]
MDQPAPSTRSRRRRTASTDGDGVQVVIPTIPPSSSSTKSSSRAKRERKPSSSRDHITPPPPAPADEPPRKMRLRSSSSPGKGSDATAQATQATKQDATDAATTSDKASPSSSSSSRSAKSAQTDAGGAASEKVSPSKSKATSSKAKARSARKTSPATKSSEDLASELFADDGDDDKEAKTWAVAADKKADTAPTTTASSDAQAGTQVEVVIPSRKRRRADSGDSQIESQPSSSSYTTAVDGESVRTNATDAASLQLRIRQLEHQLAQSKAKAEQSAGVVGAQHSIFKELHGQCICHICLEPSFRPCVLAPCGHVFCIHCLRAWFTKPLASEADPPSSWTQDEIDRYQRSRTLKRKKICPSCRTELACPPVEVFLVRDMLEKVDQGLLLSKDADDDSQRAESSTAILSVDDKVRQRGEDLPKGAKLWEDIFDQDGPRRIIFDEVDGVPRCGSCGSEILDGACSNPSCGIEYDSDSDYEGLRRGGWDDVDDFDSDHDSEDEDGDGGGARRPRHNGRLADRLADFEARHGRSEGLHRGHRLELPDDFTGITYIDSSDNEHMVEDYDETGRLHRMYDAGRRHGYGDDDDEDDEEMDDFIVRDDVDEARGGGEDDDDDDDDEDRPSYFDRSGSEDEGSIRDGYPRYLDDEADEEEEDDFLPGPRRGGRGAAIEISDDDDEEGEGDRESSVEYRGHRGGRSGGGRRVVDDDDDDDDERFSEVESVVSASDEDGGGYGGQLGSSTDSSVRRRRARIVDDDENEDDM